VLPTSLIREEVCVNEMDTRVPHFVMHTQPLVNHSRNVSITRWLQSFWALFLGFCFELKGGSWGIPCADLRTLFISRSYFGDGKACFFG
jgi:hypothetical protein